MRETADHDIEKAADNQPEAGQDRRHNTAAQRGGPTVFGNGLSEDAASRVTRPVEGSS